MTQKPAQATGTKLSFFEQALADPAKFYRDDPTYIIRDRRLRIVDREELLNKWNGKAERVEYALGLLREQKLAMISRQDAVGMPPMCESCGTNRSDPPSKLCAGCQAYMEHMK